MRWQMANWIGFALALGATGTGLGTAVVIAKEPHTALEQIARELGLSEADARNYTKVVAAARNLVEKTRATLAPSPAPEVSPPPSPGTTPSAKQLEAAKAAVIAAETEASQARIRIARLEAALAQLQARASGPPSRTSSAPAALLASTSGPRPCQLVASPGRCSISFEPGSAGLDAVDRERLARLVESLDALNLKATTIEVVGLADRRGGDEFRYQDLECAEGQDSLDAQLACSRAKSVQTALETALAGRAGVEIAPLKARLALTSRASPSYRRTDILITENKP